MVLLNIPKILKDKINHIEFLLLNALVKCLYNIINQQKTGCDLKKTKKNYLKIRSII